MEFNRFEIPQIIINCVNCIKDNFIQSLKVDSLLYRSNELSEYDFYLSIRSSLSNFYSFETTLGRLYLDKLNMDLNDYQRKEVLKELIKQFPWLDVLINLQANIELYFFHKLAVEEIGEFGSKIMFSPINREYLARLLASEIEKFIRSILPMIGYNADEKLMEEIYEYVDRMVNADNVIMNHINYLSPRAVFINGLDQIKSQLILSRDSNYRKRGLEFIEEMKVLLMISCEG